MRPVSFAAPRIFVNPGDVVSEYVLASSGARPMRREYTSPSPVPQSFTAVQLTLN